MPPTRDPLKATSNLMQENKEQENKELKNGKNNQGTIKRKDEGKRVGGGRGGGVW